MLDIGEPSSKGVPADFAKHTLTLPYNDSQAIKDCFANFAHEIAGVIVEPVAGNMNMIVPSQDFHQTLREQCTKHGAVLIFDEVMTGFRVGMGGAQAYFGIVPDLTTFGKIIGAGLPVGAFGGKKEIMSCIAPLGGVYQAGTLSGNPLAMRAGIAMFDLLTQAGFYRNLAEKVVYLTENLQQLADDAGIKFATFFHGMLSRGVYLAPSAFEAGFMSSEHSQEDLDKTLAIAKDVFAEMAKNNC